ncbi:uncharacterized protein [Dermacentor albipictus]
MGVVNPKCDNAKVNISVDFLDDPTVYVCFHPKAMYPLGTVAHGHSKQSCDTIPVDYRPRHYCMNNRIKYDSYLPTHEGHRPLWPVFGEYKYVPPQRWLHNIEHGAIVMLYHPCTHPYYVDTLRNIVTGCLRKHVITPYVHLSPERPPVKTGLQLATYGGAPLEIVGQAGVPVVYREQHKLLPVVVVPGRKPSLLGRVWLAELRIDWKCVFTVQTDRMVEKLLRKYSDVFSMEVGLIKGHKAHLVLKKCARPVFCKARPVLFSLRTAVEEEIRQLERSGVLVPVAQSDWATPVVVVPKADKKVRLCGDFKITLNPCIMMEH